MKKPLGPPPPENYREIVARWRAALRRQITAEQAAASKQPTDRTKPHP